MMTKIDPDHMAICPDWAPLDPRGVFLALAIAGEAGELANIAKKEWRDDKDLRNKKIQEMGDIVAYVRMLAAHMGVDDIIALSDQGLLAFEQRPGYAELVVKAKLRSSAYK